MGFTVTSTLMENHVAGTKLPEMTALAVSCASDQSPVLFAVDTKYRLSVTMRTPEQTTGWLKQDLTDQLVGLGGLGPSPLVQCLASVQNANGSTWLAIAAASGDPHGQSVILLSQALPNDPSAVDWDQFGQQLTVRTVPAGAAFHELVIGSADDGAGAPAVVGGAMVGGVMQHYVFNPDPNDTSWTCLPVQLPELAYSCLAATAGNIPGLGRGIYTLCVVKGADGLECGMTFTTMPVVVNGVVQPAQTRSLLVPPPYAPTSKAALAALPVGDGLTELYLSGQGLHRYPLSLQKFDDAGLPIELFAKPDFDQTPQLAVSCDPGADRIDVWAINYYDQLVYTTGFADSSGGTTDEPEYTWQIPISLAMEVTAIAGYRAPLPPSTDTAPRAGAAPGAGVTTQAAIAYASPDFLNLMLKDSSTELWQTQTITTQVQNSAFTLNTYTTQILVTDDDDVAVPGAEILIRPSTDVPALVNGKYYALKSNAAKSAIADSGGMVTIMLETTDLFAPDYEITVSGAAKTADPAMNLKKALRGIDSGEQILEAMRTDGTGPVIKDPGDMTDACDAVASGIHSLMGIYDEKAAAGLRAGAFWEGRVSASNGRVPQAIGCRRTPDGRLEVLRGEALQVAYPDDFWDVVESVGDLLLGAVSGTKETVSWVLKQAGDVWNFVVYIGEQALGFAIQVAEQAIAAIDCIIKATLGLSIYDIIAWLGFLFDWSDIKQTHLVLAHVYELGITYIKSQMSTYESWILRALDDAESSLVNDQLQIPMTVDPFGSKARKATSSPSYETPEASWANRKLADNSGQTQVEETPVSDPGDPFSGISATSLATMQQIASGFKDQLGSDYSYMDWGPLVDVLLPLLGVAAIEAAKEVTQLTAGALEGAIDSFQDVAAFHWDIPVLTWLYEDVIFDDGSKLTLLDLAALLAAVPATVTAKAATGSNVFSDEVASAILGAQNWQKMIDAIASMNAGAKGELGAAGPNQILLSAAAGCLLINGWFRVCATATEYRQRPDLTVICDWFSLFYKLFNDSLITSLRPVELPREQIDWANTASGALPCIRGAFQVGFEKYTGGMYSGTGQLSYVEMMVGCVMVVLSSFSLGLEWNEPPPDDGTSQDTWHKIVGLKFGENASGGFATILAVYEALPEVDPDRKFLQTVRIVMMGVEAVLATGLGIYALQSEQSDLV